MESRPGHARLGPLPRARRSLANEDPPPLAPRPVNGRVRVGLGQLNARKKDLHDSASWVVSRFENKYDLIAALSSSSYLPWWGLGRGAGGEGRWVDILGHLHGEGVLDVLRTTAPRGCLPPVLEPGCGPGPACYAALTGGRARLRSIPGLPAA